MDINLGDGVCTSNDGSCTLRAAVQEANNLGGDNIILIPNGNYTLTINGQNEDASVKGDIDINSNITIIGNGAVTIDGNITDRIFHVLPGNNVKIEGVKFQSGNLGYTVSMGGGILNSGNLTLINCSIVSNTGAGIHNDVNATLAINNCTLGSNSACGIYNNRGICALENSYIVGNTGSGIYNYAGTLNGYNSTIQDNRAGSWGGGIFNTGFKDDAGNISYGTVNLTNCTVVGNFAGTTSTDSRGGGIHNHYQYSKLYLYNATVAYNSVRNDYPSYRPTGGGIYTENTNVWMTNSLIAFNSYKNCSNESVGGAGIDNCLGNNLSSDSSCCGPYQNTDPLFGSFGNYGGLPPTYELLPGSPAIDTADNAYCPEIDQRGVLRPQDGDGDAIAKCDIGAYEYSSPTSISLSTFTATPKNKEIILNWKTESEKDNLGFNILRAESENGQYTKINTSLIPAQGSSTQGANYEFIDKDVKNRKTYYYKLEDIDLSGISTMHGPVSAMPRLIYGIGK